MLRKIDHERSGRATSAGCSAGSTSRSPSTTTPEMHFGALRVLNDDLVAPGSGFDLHPHSDFEILSYVVDGRLTHADSMGNTHTLSRGEVQYMSAGTGVWHSEHNRGDETLRFLQIWIFPDAKGHEPAYGDHRFAWDEREGRWLHVAAGDGSPVTVHQDVHISVAEIQAGAGPAGRGRPPGVPASGGGLVQRQRRRTGRARRARDRRGGRRRQGGHDVPRVRHGDGEGRALSCCWACWPDDDFGSRSIAFW